MQYDLGFIGCGHMGGALATAAARCAGARIALSDRDGEKARTLAAALGCEAVDTRTAAAHSRYVVLGVKPQMMAELAQEIAPALVDSEKLVLVSMAAGLEMASIQRMFGAYPVIRIMPNIPCAVGAGMITYCHTMDAAPHVQQYLRLMAHAGRFDRIDEGKMDAASAVAGCGPAFASLFIEALSDGGVQCGLTREQALLYARQMLLGTAQMALENGVHPAEFKDSVCSPGGSTIAGVAQLEDGAFRGTVMRAVRAACERNRELGE